MFSSFSSEQTWVTLRFKLSLGTNVCLNFILILTTGDCPPCPKTSEKKCMCGKKKAIRKCAENVWSCQQVYEIANLRISYNECIFDGPRYAYCCQNTRIIRPILVVHCGRGHKTFTENISDCAWNEVMLYFIQKCLFLVLSPKKIILYLFHLPLVMQ